MSSLNDFKLEKILGKGAYSVVLLVHRILDGQTYAMKQVRINQLSDKEKQNSLNEIRILASLSHKSPASSIIFLMIAVADSCSISLNVAQLLSIFQNKSIVSSLLYSGSSLLFLNSFSNQVLNHS